jgi:hypothetical protein
MKHWFSAYLLWFAPLALAGLLAHYDCWDRARAGERPLLPDARRPVDPIHASTP